MSLVLYSFVSKGGRRLFGVLYLSNGVFLSFLSDLDARLPVTAPDSVSFVSPVFRERYLGFL